MSRVCLSVLLPLVIGLTRCSDDGDKPPIDTGTPDQAVVDRGPASEASVDGAPWDQAVVDAVQPDTTPVNPSGWAEVMTAPKVLNGIWGAGANNVFAVGKDGTIMLWDGSKWGAMTNTEKDDLFAAWGNTTKVWAVGNNGDVYWDGSTWTKGSSASTSYNFLAVDGGQTNLYAVGTTNYVRYKSQTSTSTSWSSISLSSLLSGKSLRAIRVFSDSEALAVGDNGVIVQCTASCTSSSNWKAMTSGVTSHLNAVWASSNNDIYAVGLDGTVLHYDGTQWSKKNLGTSTYFYGVWGSGASDVWVVGHPMFKTDESIFHYDGTSWTKSPPPKTSFLNAVWGSGPKDVWAVGKSNILHFTGKP